MVAHAFDARGQPQTHFLITYRGARRNALTFDHLRLDPFVEVIDIHLRASILPLANLVQPYLPCSCLTHQLSHECELATSAQLGKEDATLTTPRRPETAGQRQRLQGAVRSPAAAVAAS